MPQDLGTVDSIEDVCVSACAYKYVVNAIAVDVAGIGHSATKTSAGLADLTGMDLVGTARAAK
jgi:hypothetical protein